VFFFFLEAFFLTLGREAVNEILSIEAIIVQSVVFEGSPTRAARYGGD